MKLLNISLTNFGSYESLAFNFADLGLTLIHGATGSGKSTLQDAVCWCLFGVTAKDGNADDIRSWNSEEPTNGELTLLAKDNQEMIIVRTRGTSSKNDLYWIEDGGLIRGKDITETQKLLEQRLGVSKDLYLAGAYFNEFSPTGSFFTAKAKDRRELFENLANLDLSIKLAESTTNDKKTTKKIIAERTEEINRAGGRLYQLRESKAAAERDAERWSQTQEKLLEKAEEMQKKFEEHKAKKIEDLKDKIATLRLRLPAEDECSYCGNPNKEYSDMCSEIKNLEYAFSIEKSKEVLKSQTDTKNPFLTQIDRFNKEIPSLQDKLLNLDISLNELTYRLESLTQLYDLSSNLRAELLRRVVDHIQSDTNRYLEKYFDSEIRVEFELGSTDSLEIKVLKNSHECTYKQLSKGQRGLLKLCFSVSVMKAAANKAGVHFSTLFYDEALDGLDVSLKLKAFRLFEELSLSHESILVIDHSEELKALFNKKYHVTIDSDISTIEED